MPAFTIDEVVVPPTLDAPGAEQFVEALDVGNIVNTIGYGTSDLAYEPAEELPQFSDPHEPHRMLAASVAGKIVARALYQTHVGEGADTAWIIVEVLPEFRRRGIGAALADAVEAIARGDGKAKALVYTPIPNTPNAQQHLNSPTGFGSIALNADARFLLARGYSFEQVGRLSRLTLPVAGIDRLLADAEKASGPDYAVRYWRDATPERWQADVALLGTRMSTDAPSAGLEEPEDVWTIERVIEADERAKLNPRTRLFAVAEHIPSGTLAGYTVLSVPRQSHRAVDQYATLVLREHRGHALGKLMKVANLAHLARLKPGHPSVVTFNAEENRHMLDVNESLGFVGIANESAWRKDL
ncbi:MAG: GNAT family N-acetyltransferase [Rhodoglobus sp.]